MNVITGMGFAVNDPENSMIRYEELPLDYYLLYNVHIRIRLLPRNAEHSCSSAGGPVSELVYPVLKFEMGD